MPAFSHESPYTNLSRITAESFIKRLEFQRVLPSTNDLAMQLAAETELETPLLVLAEEQTAGRGRGGNRWWSGPGALTFSLILEPALANLKPSQWPKLAITAGLSVCEVLGELVPGIHCGLKWPNDVLLAGRKVCGILVEVPACRPPAPQRIVLGMGINVNNTLANAPTDVALRGTTLRDVCGHPFELATVLIDVLNQFSWNLQALAADEPQLAGKWQAACVLRGRTVQVQFGTRNIRGLCGGIDSQGALLIETEEGRQQLFGGVLVTVE